MCLGFQINTPSRNLLVLGEGQETPLKNTHKYKTNDGCRRRKGNSDNNLPYNAGDTGSIPDQGT